MKPKRQSKGIWPSIFGFKEGDPVRIILRKENRVMYGWIISHEPHDRILVGVVKEVTQFETFYNKGMYVFPEDMIKCWTDAPPMPQEVKDSIALRKKVI